MQRLLLLFTLFLVGFSNVFTQGKPICKLPAADVQPPPTSISRQGPDTNTVPVPMGRFPPVPDEILNISLVDQNGTNLTIGGLRGKVVLLHLWATWVGPFTEKNPFLIELQEKYKDEGLTIVGLNIGNGNGSKEKRFEITKFAERFKVNYDIVEEVSFGTMTGAIYKLTKFEGVPQSLLIDREGKLRGLFLGAGPRTNKIEKEVVERLMNEKQPVTQ